MSMRKSNNQISQEKSDKKSKIKTNKKDLESKNSNEKQLETKDDTYKSINLIAHQEKQT